MSKPPETARGVKCKAIGKREVIAPVVETKSLTLYESVSKQSTAHKTVVPCEFLIKRLLGTNVNSTPFLSHDPISLYTLYYMIPRLLNIPSCDLKRFCSFSPFCSNLVDSKVRRDIMTISSTAFESNYCTAHACSIGNALTGPFSRTNAVVATKSNATETTAASPAWMLAEAASLIPHKVTNQMMEDVRQEFGEKGFKQIAGFISMMGWLNNTMEGCGVPLESYFVSKHKGRPLWKLPIIILIAGHDLLATGVSALHTKMIEKSWFKGKSEVLVSRNPLDVLEQKIGFVPDYISALDAIEAQRAIVIVVEQGILRNGHWTSHQKVLLWFGYAVKAKNDVQKRDARQVLLNNFNVDDSVMDAIESGIFPKSMTCAFEFVEIMTVVPRNSEQVQAAQKAVMDEVKDSGAIVELLCAMSAMNMLQRLSAILAK